MEPSWNKEEENRAPIGTLIGASSDSQMWMKTNPKLRLEPSGFVDEKTIMEMDRHIASTWDELNTPDIKLDEELFGEAPQSYKYCNTGLELAAAQVERNHLECSSMYSSSTVLLDLSPAPPLDDLHDLHQQRIDLSVPNGSVGVNLVDNQQSVVSPPSPSDFLNDSGLGDISSDFSCMDPPVHGSTDDEFFIPPEVLEQMDTLFGDGTVLPDEENISSMELDFSIVRQEDPPSQDSDDLLRSLLQDSGILEQETYGPVLSSEAEECSADLPREEAKNVFQDIDFVQPHYSSVPSISTIYSKSPTVVPDPLVVPPSLLVPQTVVSQDVLLPKTVRPSQAALSPPRCGKGVKSGVGPIRVTRQRRSSRKPLRYRETVVLEDLDSVTPVDTPVAPVEEPKASTSTTATPDSSSEQETLTEKDKYNRIRMLNNLASQRCRQRRKITMKDMEGELQVLQQRNQELRNKEKKLTNLRNQVKTIVNEFFKKCTQ